MYLMKKLFTQEENVETVVENLYTVSFTVNVCC